MGIICQKGEWASPYWPHDRLTQRRVFLLHVCVIRILGYLLYFAFGYTNTITQRFFVCGILCLGIGHMIASTGKVPSVLHITL